MKIDNFIMNPPFSTKKVPYLQNHIIEKCCETRPKNCIAICPINGKIKYKTAIWVGNCFNAGWNNNFIFDCLGDKNEYYCYKDAPFWLPSNEKKGIKCAGEKDQKDTNAMNIKSKFGEPFYIGKTVHSKNDRSLCIKANLNTPSYQTFSKSQNDIRLSIKCNNWTEIVQDFLDTINISEFGVWCRKNLATMQMSRQIYNMLWWKYKAGELNDSTPELIKQYENWKNNTKCERIII